MISKSILYTGTDTSPAVRVALRAGKLTMFFEQDALRHVCYGEREVLRRVYVAVRDRNWGTIPAQLSDLTIETELEAFRIRFMATCDQGDIAFRWRGAITGEADSTLTFAMEGEALSEFWCNRIGFCVLHPIAECAGQPCVLTHTDGSHEQSTFPREIAPHQPFYDLRAITHEVAPGVLAEIVFGGDVFETEDQRNWSDASFKTYCTPLARPFPVLVKVGERVEQQIRVGLIQKHGISPQSTQRSQSFYDFSAFSAHSAVKKVCIGLTDGPWRRLPEIGVGQAAHGQTLSAREVERLRALRLAHLRADLYPAGTGFPEALRHAAEEAAVLGVKLELALHLADAPEEELRARQALLREAQARTARYLILRRGELCTRARWVALAREILGDAIPIGAGADSNFTELNREPPELADLDFVFYAANPQVHASDALSLVENLAGLGETVRSARALAAGKPVVVSPVTLKARFNVVATGPEPEPAPGTLPKPVDPRQMSLFGAGWTLGSLKHLAKEGAVSVTYYETTGWRGVIETEAGSPLPALFPSLPGSVFPLYHVLASVGEFAGGEAHTPPSETPLRVESLILRQGDRLRVLLANLDAQPVQVQFTGLPSRLRLKRLDETTVFDALQSPEHYRSTPGDLVDGADPITLFPYAVAQLDV